MSAHGVQGQLLEINVVGGRNLRDTEWLSKQDPYVVIVYGTQKFRTKTDTDGGRNPTFNDKFTISLIEGLPELSLEVWNSNSVTVDDHIGSARVQLERVISTGYDDNSWTLSSRSGKHAGEIKLIMHGQGKGEKNKAGKHGGPPAGYPPHTPPQQHGYGGYPPAPAAYPPPPAGYAPAYPPQATAYPPQSTAYPPQAYPQPGAYSSTSTAYPVRYPSSSHPYDVHGHKPHDVHGHKPHKHDVHGHKPHDVHGYDTSYAYSTAPHGYPVVVPPHKYESYGHGYSEGKHKKDKNGKAKKKKGGKKK